MEKRRKEMKKSVGKGKKGKKEEETRKRKLKNMK